MIKTPISANEIDERRRQAAMRYGLTVHNDPAVALAAEYQEYRRMVMANECPPIDPDRDVEALLGAWYGGGPHLRATWEINNPSCYDKLKTALEAIKARERRTALDLAAPNK